MKTDSIEQLFRTYHSALCQYAARYVEDKSEAEDIVMDCYEKFLKKKDDDAIRSMKSYLYRMVHNACIEYNRKARLQGGVLQDDAFEDNFDADDHSEQAKRVLFEIDSLPEACRNIFLLSKRDGMKNREIAEELGLSVKTVEAQITKAYRRIRRNIVATLLVVVATMAFAFVMMLGWYASQPEGKTPSPIVQPADTTSIIEKRDSSVVLRYNNEPIGNILRELSTYYGSHLSTTDSTRCVSGELEATSLDEIIDILQTVLDIDIVKQ